MIPRLNSRAACAIVLGLLLFLSLFSALEPNASEIGILSISDFSISVSPSTLTVMQGASGTTTVIITSQGNFSSPVSLAMTGLPTGTVAGFGTNPLTPPIGGTASSPLIISVGASVPPGSYTLTLTATNGTLTHSSDLSLNVTPSGPPPDFTVTVAPSSLLIDQGDSATATVTVGSMGGFSSSVVLTAIGPPAGLSVSFAANPVTPPSGGSANSVILVSASYWTTTGVYAVTIAGSSGALTHSTTITVIITQSAASDFSLTSSPSTITLTQGSSGTSTITISSINGFTSLVRLSASWIGSTPTGISFTIPSAVTPPPNGITSVTATIATSSTAPIGSFAIRITGTSGILRHSIDLIVQVILTDFTITASPTSLSMIQGGLGTSAITVQSSGSFSSQVTLTSLGVPSGISLAFGTNPLTPPAGGIASTTLTIAATNTATAGTYIITVAGSSSSLLHNTTLTVTIRSVVVPDFSLASSTSRVVMTQSSTSTAAIMVSSQNGFGSTVSLSGSWLIPAPNGVTFSIAGPMTPVPNATATSTLTIAASASASVGNFTLRITGVSGSLIHFSDVVVQISGPQCFIATATYGSELSPEVQFLRNFRDNEILKTNAGSGFMIAFNEWYYSFSPAVAQLITQHSTLRSVMRVYLYPLIWILRIGTRTFYLLPNYPEASAVISGLVISWLIGATYLALPTTLALNYSSKGQRTAKRLVKPLAVLMVSVLSLLILLEVVRGPSILMIFATSLTVLGALTLSTLLTSRLILRLLNSRRSIRSSLAR